MAHRNGLTPEKIKHIRERAGMTRNEFAQTFDASPTSVYNWENGISSPDQYREAAIRRLEERLDEMENEERRQQFIQTILGIGLAVGVAALLEELFGS